MKILKIIYGSLTVILITSYIIISLLLQDFSTKIFNIISIAAGSILFVTLLFHVITYLFSKIKNKEKLKEINYSIMSFCLVVATVTINLYAVILNTIVLCVAVIFFWLSFCDK